MIPLLVFSVLPRSNAGSYQIPSGFLVWYHTDKPANYMITNWTVHSGPSVDVYLFTEFQYNNWKQRGFPELPVEAVWFLLDTYGGEYERSMDETDKFYLVFSNVYGDETILLEAMLLVQEVNLSGQETHVPWYKIYPAVTTVAIFLTGLGMVCDIVCLVKQPEGKFAIIFFAIVAAAGAITTIVTYFLG